MFRDYSKASDLELRDLARRRNLREVMEEKMVLTDERRFVNDYALNRREVIKQLSERDNRIMTLWILVIGVLSLAGWFVSFVASSAKTGTSDSQYSTNISVPDGFGLKHKTTEQFLQMISNASDIDKAKLFKSHSALVFEAGSVMEKQVVGLDYVGAAQSSTTYLVDKLGWDPVPAADILNWYILKIKASLFIQPELWNALCAKDTVCPPLTQDAFYSKLENEPSYHFSEQDIHGVLEELAANEQAK